MCSNEIIEQFLEDLDIGFYESGAYYDSTRERYEESLRVEFEKEWQLSLVEV